MPAAVLLSCGLDSAVLLAEEAARGEVQPVYVSTGLAWEAAEQAMLPALVGHTAGHPTGHPIGHTVGQGALGGRVRPLVTLTFDMRDVYRSTHWAVLGRPPAYNTPDEDVYLPGRNIILLGKAAVYCATAGLDRIVLGTLGHNPFPDATPAFRDAMAQALSLGLAHPLRIEAPYAALGKPEIVRRGVALGVPFGLTMSCMNPQREPGEPWYAHCGLCSKCRERHDAFLDAGIPDPTRYADERYVHA